MNIGDQNLFTGGRWTPSESGETYESLDPFTGKTATRAASATAPDVGRAVVAAQDAFRAWAALPPSERRRLASPKHLPSPRSKFGRSGAHSQGG